MRESDPKRIKDWLFNAALPIWLERANDREHGGTREQLALDGSASDAGFKRVRVPARQIYVFSHASIMGWSAGLAEAKRLYENFVATAWRGKDKGWAKRLTSDNQILDPTLDLYDNAFALFSLAWYYRASGDAGAKQLALDTANCINTQLRHPKLGFWHQLPGIGPRIQNPHMHLLEASLVCLEVFGEPVFESFAREIVDLFRNKFFDAHSNTLGEYFDDDFNLLAGPQGQIVEPGHQLEWAWILAKAQTLLEIDLASKAASLVESAERFGVHRNGKMRGTTKNSITITGENIDAGSRTWPNTERLKAAVAMHDLFGTDPTPVVTETLDALFRLHLNHPIRGLWIDAFDEHGEPVATATPTATLYHVFLAFAEVLRIATK